MTERPTSTIRIDTICPCTTLFRATEGSHIEQANPTARPAIWRAWSAARNPARVIEELTAGIANCDPALITVFVSSNLPYEDIVAPLSAIYPEVPLVGCTTAGSLTCDSYEADGSIADRKSVV